MTVNTDFGMILRRSCGSAVCVPLNVMSPRVGLIDLCAATRCALSALPLTLRRTLGRRKQAPRISPRRWHTARSTRGLGQIAHHCAPAIPCIDGIVRITRGSNQVVGCT